MKQGLKTATSRTKCYGDPGDWFKAFGGIFIIVNVHKLQLVDIAHLFYREEGFKTKEDFMAMWAKIHPRVGFQPDKKVYLHKFVPARNALEFHVHELLPNGICQICGSLIEVAPEVKEGGL